MKLSSYDQQYMTLAIKILIKWVTFKKSVGVCAKYF